MLSTTCWVIPGAPENDLKVYMREEDARMALAVLRSCGFDGPGYLIKPVPFVLCFGQTDSVIPPDAFQRLVLDLPYRTFERKKMPV